jgi:hypothetical protein
MGRFAGLVLPVVFLAILPLAVATPVFADHIDGMTLKLSHAPGPGSVALDWTGGQPTFRVYRSASKTLIVDPSNLIGTTDVRTFSDTPPVGAVFFYEIGSPCVYSPPEICNGLDDDCDGTIDGPGSEASCSLPHAVATCSAGGCAIASCQGGFGDCNTSPADGCEAPLAVLQSNSPAAIWANDPNPDKDLVPGFARVASITNCGGCGITCDDGIPCTTDLCVQVQQARTIIGTCRHYDRGQCSEARCGGLPLAPGTPTPGDAACTAPDSDGDGLSDPWETSQQNPYDLSQQQAGIDIDCDGQITDSDGDDIYADPPAGPAVKDIYLKIAYMGPPVPAPPEEAGGHAPLPGVVEAAVAAFQRHGMVLHVDPVRSEVPHAATVSLSGTGSECGAADGTTVGAIKGAVFDQRKKFTHHFVVFGHDSCSTPNPGTAQAGTTGLAEIKGNDLVVTLGEFQYAGPPAVQVDEKDREQSGTLMHELGHTLGLDHGGSSDLPCSPTPCDPSRTRKPNYISSMNYSYQLNGILRAATPGSLSPPDPEVPWRVDFSSGALGTLDEGNLDEQQGLTGATPPYDRDIARYYCLGQGPFYAAGAGPVDWNCDHVFSPSVTSDIDDDQVFSTLNGASDWDHLDFRFQCQPAFAESWTDPALGTRNELTHQFADLGNLRAISPPCETDADCDDGLFCNGAETCQPATGLCLPGTPPTCDDGNSCTTDVCSTTAGACVNASVADGTACDDGAWCTVGESCTAGVCGGAVPRSCEDGLACTANACSEALDMCVVASCTTAPCFSTPVGSGVAAGSPRSDRSIVPAGVLPSTFVVKGSALYALRNAGDPTGPAGSVRWTWNNASGQPVNNFPSPVPLSTSGSEVIFLGAADGFLYKIRASDGVQTGLVDTRRSTCPSDQIFATPAVQLYNLSNATWRIEMDSHSGHTHDDVVFVITRNACADVTHNRVFAYYASDLSIKAIYNDTGGVQLNAGFEACAVDYANNRLYCGTDQSATLPTQNSLWAFDTRTLTLVWSDRVGSIQNRPMLTGGRLYVAARDGSIMAYDPAGGPTGKALRLWTNPATVPASVLRNPWVEFRPPAGLNSIFVLDGVGAVHRFTDQGSVATHDWSVSPGAGLQFTTMPVLFPGVERLYVGRNDGRLQQIDATSGTPMPPVLLSPAGDVFDAGLDFTPGAAFGWLTVPSGVTPGGVTGFCAPLP